jgi:hypothetical protein
LFGALSARVFINSLECNAHAKFRKQTRMEIEGKRILVTGASRGLGRAREELAKNPSAVEKRLQDYRM